jgi:hypothetical protein
MRSSIYQTVAIDILSDCATVIAIEINFRRGNRALEKISLMAGCLPHHFVSQKPLQ